MRAKQQGEVTRLAVPVVLINTPHWVAWLGVQGTGTKVRLPNGSFTGTLMPRDKPYKLPINPHSGGLADPTRSGTWGTYQQALAAVPRFAVTGVGYVFSDDEKCSGVDLDDCRDPVTGIIADWANAMIAELCSYTEVSPSRTGVKIWVIGNLEKEARNRRAYEGGQVEMYSRDRFFVFTGLHLAGTPTTVECRQAELLTLHARLFPEDPKPKVEQGARADGGCLSDYDLLHGARTAANGAKFSRLFAGKWKGDHHSQSEADLALCSHLAFWTVNDRPRMDSLFRQSGLMREKWEREDYRSRTMDKAIASNRSTFRHKKRKGVEEPARREIAAEFQGNLPAEELAIRSSSPPDAAGRETTAPQSAGRSSTTKLIQLVSSAELFRTPDGKPYATVLRDGHCETHSIRSRGFRNYLQWVYYSSSKGAISSKALSESLGVLESRAVFGGSQSAVSCRVAGQGDTIYIDRGGAGWDAIEVTRARPTIEFVNRYRVRRHHRA